MNTILPLLVAVLLVGAPTFPYIQALFPSDNAPDVPFHTPAQTEGKALPGHIEQSLTLTPKDGIILVNQMVTVDKDAILTIKPGTILAVAEYGGFEMLGNLHAVGTEKDPIQFISNELNETNRNWNGIVFEETGSGRVEHALFHHASPSISCTMPGNVVLKNNRYLFGNIDLFGSC